MNPFPVGTMRPSVIVRCSAIECGSLSQPAARSFGTTSLRQVSASEGIYDQDSATHNQKNCGGEVPGGLAWVMTISLYDLSVLTFLQTMRALARASGNTGVSRAQDRGTVCKMHLHSQSGIPQESGC